jgi:hypothetical protein
MTDDEAKELKKTALATATDVQVIKVKLEALEKLVATFVTRPEFDPVKMIAYGMAGSVLLTVLGAIMARIIAK